MHSSMGFLLFLFSDLPQALAQAPVSLRWSTKTYGPDGPWNAMTVSVGNPAKEVDVYPAGQYGSFIFDENACSNKTLNTELSTCAVEKAGVWNYNTSTTALAGLVDFEPGLSFNTPLPLRGGTSGMILDNAFMQYNGPAKPVPNASLISVDWAYNIYPGGQNVPVSLGTLCLGAASVNWTFNIYSRPNSGFATTSGSVNASILQSSLWTQGIIPSASFGLHIGSVGSNIPPSLWQGGYDQSRALNPVISQAISDTGTFAVTLVDIVIGTGDGASIFGFSNKTGILRQGNSSILPSGLTVNLEPGTPYLFLPRSTCDAIVQSGSLPVNLDESLGLYIWNTSSPNYTTIVSSANYVGFTFRAPDGGEMTVKAPWQLFNLTLTSPLVDQDVQYFPCSPYAGEDYTLGRAFLQAAFLGTNWKPTAPPAYWFLAQAPGPNTPTTPLSNSILESANSIEGLSTAWESTWSGFWTVKALPLTSNPKSTGNSTMASQPAPESRFSLSTSAKIGIVFGGGLVLLLSLYIIGYTYGIRRQKARNKHGQMELLSYPGSMATIEHNNLTVYEKDGSVLCEADSWSQPFGVQGNPAEVAGHIRYQELPPRISRYELASSRTPKTVSWATKASTRLSEILPPLPPAPPPKYEYERREGRSASVCPGGTI